MYSLLALQTPIPLICFATEEITGSTIAAAKDASKAPTKPPSCFLFHVLLFQ